MMLFFSLFSAEAICQSTKSINDTTTLTKQLKPLQVIDGLILGNGLFVTVNYDTRFKPSNKGLGLRAGIGLLLGAAIPVSVNYLIGNNNKRSFLEIGAGGTLYFKYKTFNFLDENQIIPVTYIMYRYQALKSPNTFRIGITQLYVFGEDYAKYRFYYPSLSLGHILGRRN